MSRHNGLQAGYKTPVDRPDQTGAGQVLQCACGQTFPLVGKGEINVCGYTPSQALIRHVVTEHHRRPTRLERTPLRRPA